MSRVLFESVKKSFGEVEVVKGFDFEVQDGEFVAFLGPSGCGKTTCLRMVSGLEQNTSGRITIGDNLVSDGDASHFVAPEKRNVGMVFQSYAVWPHMNLFDNVSFPLKMAKVDKEIVATKVEKVLEMVELAGLEGRMPNQLSGGQQQRVALARGLVAEPDVLLLDEPLSNLDAKLREKMRRDIRSIQKELKMTVIYVTHDQIEATEMSDRMIIMNEGKIIQSGSPGDMKANPQSEFVRDFLNLK